LSWDVLEFVDGCLSQRPFNIQKQNEGRWLFLFLICLEKIS